MNTIKIHDKYFTPFISAKEIDSIVTYLVEQVSRDISRHEVPLFIGILNGSFLFASDFIRKYKGECEVSFVKLASYEGLQSKEVVNQLIGINEDLEDRTVIILEDIIDTGSTLQKVYEIFKDKNVKELKIATLFFKPDVYKKELRIDYIGKNIEDKFIVGYGLDYDGLGRNLSSVFQLTTEST